MKYTISQFKKDFPSDIHCLHYLFRNRYGKRVICPKCGNRGGFYHARKRKCYACSRCGYQIHPSAGTIFHKSSTKLTNWFFAIYLMSKSKNGVSAKELQRHLGTTYKTAWRIGNQIRSLMKQDDEKLDGTIEADETYIGGVKKGKHGCEDKIPVMGIVQRGGKIKSKQIPNNQTQTLLGMLRDNVKFGSHLITDENSIYKKVGRIGLFHDAVKHSIKEYVRGGVYTNTIEGFWSQMKRSIDGTYHSISAKHLQSYIDEFVYHYNHRFSSSFSSSLFHDLLSRLCGQRGLGGQKIHSFVGVPVSS